MDCDLASDGVSPSAQVIQLDAGGAAVAGGVAFIEWSDATTAGGERAEGTALGMHAVGDLLRQGLQENNHGQHQASAFCVARFGLECRNLGSFFALSLQS